MSREKDIAAALYNFLPDYFGTNCASEHSIELLCLLYDHLVKSSRKYNLVADNSWNQYLYRHILDSLAPLKFDIFKSGDTIIDIGSGAGFPGFPIAIIKEDINLISIESIRKKADFQSEAVDLLHAENIQVINERIETVAHGDLRNTADKTVSRAVASIPTLIEYSAPFLKINGTSILYKSPDITNELQGSENALDTLFCKVKEAKHYSISALNRNSTLILIEKTDVTPPKYPRRAGIPHKRPL